MQAAAQIANFGSYIKFCIFRIFQLLLQNHTEDLFLFGYVREHIGVEPLVLNPRFTYDEFSIQRWLSMTNVHPFPYIFAAMNSSTEDFITLTTQLWQKTTSIHNY